MTDITVIRCPHDIIEQDTACADGMCPLCLADEIKRLDGEIEWLRMALQGLIDGVTLEVNEKGGGGFVLARLSDARRALEQKP